jgi:hypothetical protein
MILIFIYMIYTIMYIKHFLQQNTAMFNEYQDLYIHKIVTDWIPLNIDTFKKMVGGSKEYSIKVGNEVYTIHVNKSKDIDYPVNDAFENAEGKKYSYGFIRKEDCKDCGALVINTDNKTAYISIIYNLEGCMTQNGINVKDKVGTKMLLIMIEWCKLRGMKKIYLNDEAQFICTTENIPIKINIAQAHTMTHGYPWYWNFGFRYTVPSYNKLAEENWKLFQTLKTNKINKESLLQVVATKLDNFKEPWKKEVKSIAKLYDEHVNNPLGDFVKAIQYKECKAFSFICRDLYLTCGYHLIADPNMVLKL